MDNRKGQGVWFVNSGGQQTLQARWIATQSSAHITDFCESNSVDREMRFKLILLAEKCSKPDKLNNPERIKERVYIFMEATVSQECFGSAGW